MNKKIIGFWFLGFSVLLVGCGDDKQETKQAVATDKAKIALQEAASSVKSAASAVAEQVGEKKDSALQAVTEVTTKVVEKTANKVSEVAAAVESAVNAVDVGEKTYKGLCFSCHVSGVAGAPKLDDKAAWGPRIASGLESLYSSAINGKGAMPSKGGNPSLSDADVKATVDYMLSKVQ